MPYLGTFEQLILFSVLQLEDEAYGALVRENIEERAGRTASIGAIYASIQSMAGGLTSELDRLAES